MKQAKKTASGKTTFLNKIDVETWQMMKQNLTLSYQARREVLAHFVPRYRTASSARKSLLLEVVLQKFLSSSK